jgi:hypothetical protein
MLLNINSLTRRRLLYTVLQRSTQREWRGEKIVQARARRERKGEWVGRERTKAQGETHEKMPLFSFAFCFFILTRAGCLRRRRAECLRRQRAGRLRRPSAGRLPRRACGSDLGAREAGDPVVLLRWKRERPESGSEGGNVGPVIFQNDALPHHLSGLRNTLGPPDRSCQALWCRGLTDPVQRGTIAYGSLKARLFAAS